MYPVDIEGEGDHNDICHKTA